jgi:uncharacterized protein YegL
MFDTFEPPRRTLVLFFIIDASEAMSGSRTGSVNAAMEELVPEIRKQADQYYDVQIKIAVMKFSFGTAWINKSGPVEADQFQWRDLHAFGAVDLGAAFRELNRKLSREEFMQTAMGSFAPAIFLLSSGIPGGDFDGGLAELKQNNWFKAALKAAVVMGDDVDKEALARFTGDSEAVFVDHSAAILKKIVNCVVEREAEHYYDDRSSADIIPWTTVVRQ